MALNSRRFSVEEIQNVQQVLWRTSSNAKTSIREATSRLLEHVRSREVFLLEQVEIMERSKMESLVEGNQRTDDETCLEELVGEVASLNVDMDSSFRPLCDSISNFGQIVQNTKSLLYDDVMVTRSRRNSEVESIFGSDFSVIEDEKHIQMPEQKATSPLADWLLHSMATREECCIEPFLGISHFDQDSHFWLLTSGASLDVASLDVSFPAEMEEEVGVWDTWLHPQSRRSRVESFNYFSEYFRILQETLGIDSWLTQSQTEDHQSVLTLASESISAPATTPMTLTTEWIAPLPSMCDYLDQKDKNIEGQEMKLATFLKKIQMHLSQPEDFWLST